MFTTSPFCAARSVTAWVVLYWLSRLSMRAWTSESLGVTSAFLMGRAATLSGRVT